MTSGEERHRDGNRWSHTHVWWIKNGRDTLGARDPGPSSDHPAQGSSTRKISPHHLWLYRPVGIVAAEEMVSC